MPVTSPHFAFPFSRSADGTSVNVVEQDSVEDVMGCVQRIAFCPLGARPERPEFGWDWPDMALMPIDPESLLDAISQFEPRATAMTTNDAENLANIVFGDQEIDINIGLVDPADEEA